MINDKFNPINSLKLVGLSKHFLNISRFYKSEKKPSVLLLSGEKGIGKSTLVHHLMFYLFDEKNYNKKDFSIDSNSSFYKKYKDQVIENIILFEKKSNSTVKINDIRALKEKISKSTLNNLPRFIIFDEIETYNVNSLNALLKTIEEPKENYFILIDNRTIDLIETIKSRSIRYNVILGEDKKKEIKEFLVKKNELKISIPLEYVGLTPGTFLHLCEICERNKISLLSEELTYNVERILNIYKKEKNSYLITLLNILISNHFFEKIKKEESLIDIFYQKKLEILNDINQFSKFNINNKLTINNIINKL